MEPRGVRRADAEAFVSPLRKRVPQTPAKPSLFAKPQPDGAISAYRLFNRPFPGFIRFVLR